MSLTVRHLNGDSTFLLLFSPISHPKPSDLTSARGAYSILIDPWIIGSSVVNAKWFAITDRVEPSAVSHLSELEEPDLVICSQNKPDHTHKETLLQLKPEGKTVIAAEPSAARFIRSWNHFDPNRIHSLTKYDHKAKFGNSLRLYIRPLSSEGLPGEVTISFIPAKHDITGLHNAIGITYQPPTRTKALASVATFDLPKTKYFHLPRNIDSILGSSPPELSPELDQPTVVDSQETMVTEQISRHRSPGHRPQLSRSSNTASSELLSFPQRPSIRPSLEDLQDRHNKTTPISEPQVRFQNAANETLTFIQTLPTPPDSPHSPTHVSGCSAHHTTTTPKSSISTLSGSSASNSQDDSRPLSVSNKPLLLHPARPKAMGILYTPHGIAKSELYPYVQNHLTKLPGALPLTLLLHSFDHQQNPWFLGGSVVAGAVGGVEIAKALMARCWISAHDEPKDDRGVAVKLIKTERMTAEEIRRELARDEWGRGYGWTCDVRSLASGKEMVLSSNERDLLVGSKYPGMGQGLGIRNTATPAEIVMGLGGRISAQDFSQH